MWLRYEYDAANRLVFVKNDGGAILDTFYYGATNARLSRRDAATNDFTFYASAGGEVLSEYTAPTSQPGVLQWTKSYISAGGRLVSTAISNGTNETIEHHHADRLGTRIVTNPTTGGYFEQETLPFGTALNAESSGATNRRFTSYERSNVTGLDYAVNRTYDSGQSRFTQVDPIGMAATNLGNPQSLNLYAYVQNQPVNLVDPSGLLEAAPLGIVTIKDDYVPFDWDLWRLSIWGDRSGGPITYREPTSIGESRRGGGDESGDAIKKDFYSKQGKIFNDCLKKVFGRDAPSEQTLSNSPVLDTSLTSSQLSILTGVSGTVVGTIRPPTGKDVGIVLIARGLAINYGLGIKNALGKEGRDNDTEALLTYGHETANLLDWRKNPKGKKIKGEKEKRKPGFVYGNKNNLDTDTGQAVEDCMKKIS